MDTVGTMGTSQARVMRALALYIFLTIVFYASPRARGEKREGNEEER